MPDAEFEAILTHAAEEGAKRALADVGLNGEEAALDIRDLRSLLDCIRLARRKVLLEEDAEMRIKKGTVVPKTGTNVHIDADVADYRTAIAVALRDELGLTHRAVKTAMRWTGPASGP